MAKNKLLTLLLCLCPLTLNAEDTSNIDVWKKILDQFNQQGMSDTIVLEKGDISTNDQELFMSLNLSQVTNEEIKEKLRTLNNSPKNDNDILIHNTSGYNEFLTIDISNKSEDIDNLLATYVGYWEVTNPRSDEYGSPEAYMTGRTCDDMDLGILKKANRVQLTKITNEELNNYNCVVLNYSRKDKDTIERGLSHFRGKYYFLVNKTTGQYLEMFVDAQTFDEKTLDGKYPPENLSYSFTQGYLEFAKEQIVVRKNLITGKLENMIPISKELVEVTKSLLSRSGYSAKEMTKLKDYEILRESKKIAKRNIAKMRGKTVKEATVVPVYYYEEFINNYRLYYGENNLTTPQIIPIKRQIHESLQSAHTAPKNSFYTRRVTIDKNQTIIDTTQIVDKTPISNDGMKIMSISNLDTFIMNGPRFFNKDLNLTFTKKRKE